MKFFFLPYLYCSFVGGGSFSPGLVARLGLDMAPFQRGLVGAEGLAKKFKSTLSQIGIGIGFAAVTGFFRSVINQASELDSVSRKLGLTTDMIQALGYAGGQFGVKQETTNLALQRFTRRLGEAQQGGGELLGIIKQYNIALTNTDGTQRSATDVLGDYADIIKNTASAQEQLRLAFKAFDSEGVDLVNVLRDGRAGLAQWIQTAAAAGAVIDKDIIKKLDEANDRIVRMKTVTTVFGGNVLGIFQDFGEGLGYAAGYITNTVQGISTDWAVAGDNAVKAVNKMSTAVQKNFATKEQLAKLSEDDWQRATDALDAQQRIVALEDKALQLRLEATAAGQNTVEWVEKEGKARALFADANKLKAAEATRADTEAKTAAEKQNALLEKKKALELDAASAAERAVTLRREIAQLQAKINGAIATGKSTLKYEVKLLEAKKAERQEQERIVSLTKQQASAQAALVQAKADYATARKDRFSFTLAEVASGTRGSIKDQFTAREIQRLEAQAAKLVDQGPGATTQIYDAKTQSYYDVNAGYFESQANKLRGSIYGLNMAEKDPLAAQSKAITDSAAYLKEINESLKTEQIK